MCVEKFIVFRRNGKMNFCISLITFSIKRCFYNMFFCRSAIIFFIFVEFKQTLWELSIVKPLLIKKKTNYIMIFFVLLSFVYGSPVFFKYIYQIRIKCKIAKTFDEIIELKLLSAIICTISSLLPV